ncbi:hypothetical protein [Lactococcus lactis]|uniref:hypothetical protein n=1 Tax=Lactococcus lactis TaxID=1358 RepID=UPI003D2767FE
MAEKFINLIQITEHNGKTAPIIQVNNENTGMIMLTNLVMSVSQISNKPMTRVLAEIKNLAPQIEANINKNQGK